MHNDYFAAQARKLERFALKFCKEIFLYELD